MLPCKALIETSKINFIAETIAITSFSKLREITGNLNAILVNGKSYQRNFMFVPLILAIFTELVNVCDFLYAS